MKNEYVDVTLTPSRTEYVINNIYQYDKGLKLRLSGLKTQRVVQIQYAVEGMKETITSIAYEAEGKWLSNIPDEALARGRPVHCYVYLTDSTTGITICDLKIAVEQRPKPDSYNTVMRYVFPEIEMYAGDTATWEVSLYSERNTTFTPRQFDGFTFTLTVVEAKNVGADGNIEGITPVIQKIGTLVGDKDAVLQFRFIYEDTINLKGNYIYQIEMRSTRYCKSQQGTLKIYENINNIVGGDGE